MRRRPVALLVQVLLAVFLAACGGILEKAERNYKHGRYAEAKSELEAMEPESRTWTGERRAEYALYRGLVHHALGDRQAAGVWLREAKAIEDVHPHTLSGDDKARLDLALESLAAP
jgi:hypothetical protein